MKLLFKFLSFPLMRKLQQLLLVLAVLSVVWVFLLKHWQVGVSPQILIAYSQGNTVRGGSSDWQKLENTGEFLRKAILLAQDPTFETHRGFDNRALGKDLGSLSISELSALTNGKIPERKPPDQKTISQQVASTVFLWQGNGWLHYGLETWFTWLIENIWDKSRILEVYLNTAYFGGGVFGFPAASNVLLNKPLTQLSNSKLALLAVSANGQPALDPKAPAKKYTKRKQIVWNALRNLPESNSAGEAQKGNKPRVSIKPKGQS